MINEQYVHCECMPILFGLVSYDVMFMKTYMLCVVHFIRIGGSGMDLRSKARVRICLKKANT